MKQFLLQVALVCGAVGFAGYARADRLDEMVSPIGNPLVFEDPRIDTELRPAYVYHKIQKGFASGGGDVRYYAVQARFAIDDRLAIIATKDGYIDFNPDPGLKDESGWADVDAGAKYAFYKNEKDGEILTAGLRYSIPLGQKRVFQGQGDGSFNPFVSGAIALGPVNLMANTGFRFALDHKDSSFYDANLHVDTPVFGIVYPTFDLNLVHVIDGGDRLPISDEGFDLMNLGASEAGGKSTLLGGAGVRVRILKDLDVGVAYQFPMTNGDGSNLTQYRWTTDLIWRFTI